MNQILLKTLRRGDWKYGRLEIRARMPNGQDIWSAIWVLPTESKYGGWAAGGEIDIVEYRGRAVETTTGALHFSITTPTQDCCLDANDSKAV